MLNGVKHLACGQEICTEYGSANPPGGQIPSATLGACPERSRMGQALRFAPNETGAMLTLA